MEKKPKNNNYTLIQLVQLTFIHTSENNYPSIFEVPSSFNYWSIKLVNIIFRQSVLPEKMSQEKKEIRITVKLIHYLLHVKFKYLNVFFHYLLLSNIHNLISWKILFTNDQNCFDNSLNRYLIHIHKLYTHWSYSFIIFRKIMFILVIGRT